jgi:hypothetical protein
MLDREPCEFSLERERGLTSTERVVRLIVAAVECGDDAVADELLDLPAVSDV